MAEGDPPAKQPPAPFGHGMKGLLATPGWFTGRPRDICSVIVRPGSAPGSQVQFRPSAIAQGISLPEGSVLPTVQKSTSPCMRRARNR